MTARTIATRQLPQAVRSMLAALEGHGMEAVAGDAAALEVLQDTHKHINPRQAALFVAIVVALRPICRSRDAAAASGARVARERLLQLYDLERLEDERTYGDRGALAHVQASHAADLAIVARSESMLAERP